MRLPRPGRPVLFTTLDLSHCRTYYTMPRRKNTNQKRPSKEPKPQLTHFLCLPLVNSTSLPQLEASVAAFKAAIPYIPRSQEEPQPKGPLADVRKPLIPDGAIRPLGTLHLTLGVMSLPSKERLQEALEYFQSLDLVAMMHEAEGKAQAQAQAQTQTQTQIQTPSNPQSFNISLESLDALPQERAATVLHAVPVDPTSRLYPFCEILRDKFLEAGFMLGDNKSAQKPQQPQVEDADKTTEGRNDSSNPTRSPKPNARPLLLHATVVNTIYVKGRRSGGPRTSGQNQGKKNERYTFDARDMLEHYRDYYLDHTRTTPRSTVIVPRASRETPALPSDAVNSGSLEQQEAVDTNHQRQRKEKRPFVWAKDFPINSVCICEMGAKKLDPSQDTSGLHARLGEKYQVIAERSLSLDKQA